MTQEHSFDRRTFDVGAQAVLPLLQGVGRIMAIGKHKGATHERIGIVDTVTIAGGRARLEGVAHDSELDLAHIHSVTADFGAMMGDKPLPRIECLGKDGEPVLSIVALDGRDGFEAAFAALPAHPAAEQEPAVRPERRELAEDDLGFAILDAVRLACAPVELRLERPGFTQAWQGPVERVSKGMGFANVITDSFHLHLRGGSVARWQWDEAAGRLVALDAHGAPIGLSISGSATALAHLAHLAPLADTGAKA